MKTRNVFISFLGTSPYGGSRYIGEKPQIDRTTRFVQVATFASVADKFGKDDQVYIFTTKESLKNWDDQPIKGDPDSVDEKLKSEILELNIGCKIDNVMVPDGKTQNEVWDIFSIIFEKLETQDNLYFDITHGFRSLPLLALPLINYAKLLKNVSVSGIFYGAYDRNKWKSSIWDLTDFSKLQDWTNNANIFLRTGNAKGLAKQIEGDGYKEIKQGLERFSEFTLVNRGMDIFSGKEIMKLSEDLEQAEESEDPAEKAVLPILNKVKDRFKDYQENTAINGFHAARWCIQNGLIQQATTLLEEFVTSFVIELIGETDSLQDEKFRMFISGALSVSEEKLRYPELASFDDNELILIARKVYSLSDYKKLSKLANQIKNSIRNDINHAGFRSAPREFSGLSDSIVKRYNDLAKVLKVRGFEISNL